MVSGAWWRRTMCSQFCLLILALHITKQPLCPWVGVQEYRDLFRVATAEVLNNVTNYLAENLDFFVLGKWLGASALGLYNRSFYLMDLPVRHFSSALSSVMFPLYSQIQGDIPRLGGVFLRTVSLTAMVIMPVLFAMATVPGIIMGGLLGEQWKVSRRNSSDLVPKRAIHGAHSRLRGIEPCARVRVQRVQETSHLSCCHERGYLVVASLWDKRCSLSGCSCNSHTISAACPSLAEVGWSQLGAVLYGTGSRMSFGHDCLYISLPVISCGRHIDGV